MTQDETITLRPIAANAIDSDLTVNPFRSTTHVLWHAFL